MNIQIQGEPVFYLHITKSVIDTCLTLSSLHYDGTCKAAGKLGGFLYGWKNHIEHFTPETLVRASFRELDLLLKICEMPVTPHDDEMNKFISCVRMALITSGRISKLWTHKVEC